MIDKTKADYLNQIRELKNEVLRLAKSLDDYNVMKRHLDKCNARCGSYDAEIRVLKEENERLQIKLAAIEENVNKD